MARQNLSPLIMARRSMTRWGGAHRSPASLAQRSTARRRAERRSPVQRRTAWRIMSWPGGALRSLARRSPAWRSMGQRGVSRGACPSPLCTWPTECTQERAVISVSCRLTLSRLGTARPQSVTAIRRCQYSRPTKTSSRAQKVGMRQWGGPSARRGRGVKTIAQWCQLLRTRPFLGLTLLLLLLVTTQRPPSTDWATENLS